MDKYEKLRDTPDYWLFKSEELRVSAAGLEFSASLSHKVSERYNLGSRASLETASGLVFAMLCGLSLELIYKAVCLAKRKEYHQTHQLENLAALSGMNANDQEKRILKFLTGCIYWASKYSVPSEKQKDSLPQFFGSMFICMET